MRLRTFLRKGSETSKNLYEKGLGFVYAVPALFPAMQAVEKAICRLKPPV